MTYIVLDMEWNQPQIHREPHKVPFPLVGEIVEIGAVKLDGRFCECDRFKRYIKPVFYKKIQPYVKKITGISENTLSCAQPFEQVLQDFFEWCADDFAFITWGPDDLPMLCDNMLAHHMDTAVIPRSYNLQLIFNKQTNGENRQWSLSAACEYLGITQSAPGHDALADAYHTALVCAKLDMRKGLAEYEGEPRPPRHYSHPYDPNRIKVHYPKRLSVDLSFNGDTADARLTRFLCPACGEEHACAPLLQPSAWTRVSQCRCEKKKNGYFFLIKLRKRNNQFYITRSVYPLTENLEKYYQQLQKSPSPHHQGLSPQ